ncbi:hypothetical protein CJF32_00009426 [Rutstroemia sp. NJR-2017a WRK4]|nr:hypothetical protein CJF32_00009426 [Rutstroemia sp. NJR-2017a WRK4]
MESAGEFKTTLPLANTSDSPMETETLLVPAAPAQFPGSFAPDLRDDHRTVSRGSGGKRIRVYFTDGWDDVQLWKSAILTSHAVMQFIEFVGSTCLCYLSAMITITIINSNTTQIAAYVGITNIFLLWLFISALAPVSGGHINPIITFATLLAGLTKFSRAVLYLVGQTAGAALAGGLIRGSLGAERTATFHGGGCYLDTNLMTEGQAYLVESVLAFTLLSIHFELAKLVRFLSFGVGLDPRQAQLFGPKLGPFMVGCTLGLTSFASIGLAVGYPGAQMNPGRCFAFAVARGEFKHQWIWWFGPVTGAVVQACVYRFAPPYRKEKAGARSA